MPSDNASSEADDRPTLDEVLDMDPDEERERRWIVLFEDDYDDLVIDLADSVAVLVDCNQACELLRLTSKVVAELAPEEAPDEEPIEAMIDRLQEVADER